MESERDREREIETEREGERERSVSTGFSSLQNHLFEVWFSLHPHDDGNVCGILVEVEVEVGVEVGIHLCNLNGQRRPHIYQCLQLHKIIFLL